MKRILIKMVLFFFVCIGLTAQVLPRLAVIELTPTGVAKSEASILTSLLETGMVKTESFTVIEQNQMSDILEAQGSTLGGCTDESCAIEMGKLLAAEQIILGEISRLGSKYIANAKIIDVTLGRNIRAEKVDADSLEGLMDQMEVLAFMLAGLVAPQSSGTVSMATDFGEVYVQSEPNGAEIYLNGASKGTAPVMVSNVPAGTNTLEARQGNYYAIEEVNVSASSLEEISLRLTIQKGNIFLKSADADLEVFFDGKSLGKLEGGLFKDLPVGIHTIEARGKDKVWRTKAELIRGKSITLQVMPKEYGSLKISLPSGVNAKLTGQDFSESLSGSKTLDGLYTGSYTLMTEANEDYKAWSGKVTVKTGNNTMTAEPEHTALWFEREEERKAAEAEKERLDKIAALDREMIDINLQISDREQRIEKLKNSKSGKLIGGGILSAIGAGFCGAVYYYMSEYQKSYASYKSASTTSDALSWHTAAQKNYDYTNYSSIGAAASLGLGTVLLLMPSFDKGKIGDYQNEIFQLKKDLANKELEKAGLEK